MISCSAPGKLYVAGEYAVTEPGHGAVLVAIDRYVTVRAGASDDGLTTVESTLSGANTLRCNGIDDLLRTPAPFAYVQSALGMAARVRIALGGAPPPCRLSITSDLADGRGTKLGLGSSGAVTVAMINVLNSVYRLGLNRAQRYRLAMLATMAVDPHASGGDVAAATWGGWLHYQAPDRTQVQRVLATRGVAGSLDAPWSGFAVRTLPAPTRLRLQVGWTGTPASSAALLTRFRARDRAGAGSRTFLAESNACVRRLAAAITQDHDAAIAHEIRIARNLLCALDRTAGIGIRTEALELLWRTAESLGIPAKSSGAGGGDCGIALVPTGTARLASQLRKRWAHSGIRTLPLLIHQTEGAA
ncbi:phosphomevalonate kinase [Nocardia colli]|uniref:Phosphomevalonate kinase n=1 Tax=Nocardia colli TaxID=2545717 RepID=A0A5N0EJL3_9NOCA|nr:phosphomevalonate kinase [Nocardia colli]KAA8889452.1 phosphomevalonate kinase [Nocardia colli]